MNPLSPLTYHRRHKQRAALLIGLVSLMTLAVYLLYTLSGANFVESLRTAGMYLNKFSVVYPSGSGELDPAIAAQIRTHPDVAHALPIKTNVGIKCDSPLGGGTNFVNLMGLRETDVQLVMELYNLTLVEGKMLQPRTNGLMISRDLATNAGIKLGDMLDYQLDYERFEFIPAPLQVVGIIEGDVRLGIVSYEYLDSHEATAGGGSLMVIPQAGRDEAVRGFLHDELPENLVWVESARVLEADMAEMTDIVNLVALPISATASLANALVVSAINRIALMRRLKEFGILNAIGFHRSRLIRRMMGETGVMAGLGWIVGLGLSWLALLAIKIAIFAPKGYSLPIVTLSATLFVLPIPVIILPFVYFAMKRVFSRLDTVAVVERGALSTEKTPSGISITTAHSSSKPLASITFYKRHTGRALLLVGSTALMIMATVLAIFYLTNTIDEPDVAILHRVSKVSAPHGNDLDPAIVSQVRTHPSVDRAVTAMELYLLSVAIPGAGSSDFASYAVSEEDALYLAQAYGLELAEGHLPRPRTNDIAIPQALAQNRDLQIGDVVGSPNNPAWPGADPLPAEFVISGIFAAPEDGGENWLTLTSLEFTQGHNAFAGNTLTLLVSARAGQKDAMDDWLEQELVGDRVGVSTYRLAEAHLQEATHDMILTMALLESLLAVVAAITLVVLNHVFITQRQSELGVLNALGFHRLKLIWRTVRETALTTGIAWVGSIALCLVGLILQGIMYAAKGLSYNWANPIPWLFTLPIPITVLLATSGTVAWMLSKLDPVAIIERR